MSPSPHFDDTLPELTTSLRRMARALVGDELAAEDLVQEAWVAALEVPRGRVRDWRPWLRGVVRRLAARERRRTRTREHHEERAARPDEVESEAELVARLSSARLLVETVDGLGDPYGVVLRMHYFDELALDEIARRMERPLATVKTWRQRGLERLREALDRRAHGDRGAWTAALVPLLRRAPKSAAAGAFVPWAAFLGAVAAAVLVGVVILALRAGGRETSDDDGPALAKQMEVGGELAVSAAPPADSARAPVAPAPSEGAPPPPTSRTPRAVPVRVVDDEGRAVVGARVLALDRDRIVLVEATTDAEGRARLEVALEDGFVEEAMLGPAPRLIVSARAPGLARPPSLFVDLSGPDRDECLLELPGPGFELRGTVVDEQGAPIAGAVVEHEMVERRMEQRGADVLLSIRPDATTDAAGRFALEALRLDLTSFRLLAEGYVPRRLALEPPAPGAVVERELVMKRGCMVRGVIRRPDGSASAGAKVTLPLPGMFWAESARATADEHGRYELRGVPEMRAFVHAVDARDPALWAGGVLETGTNSELSWDATLARRDALWIELRDEAGRPAARRVMALVSTDPELPWLTDGVTDAQGRARFRPVPEVPLELGVYGQTYVADGRMDLIVPDLRPSAELQVFHIGGAPDPQLARLSASLSPEHGSGRLFAYHFGTKSQREVTFDPRSGLAELARLQPGEYEVFCVIDDRGLLPLGPLELAPGDALDLGPIEPPPGERVRFTALPPDWSGEHHGELVAIHEAGGVEMGRSVGRIDLREALELELLPTDYRLRLDRAESIREVWFSVWPDEPLVVDVAARLAEDQDPNVNLNEDTDPDPGGR